jgi:macrolide transport system ATP-binding/permease protein
LLLDEPTSNLDFQSLEWLEHYLTNNKAAMLIASHDRQFLNNVVNCIFEIDDYSHRLKRYSGNYDEYMTIKQAERLKWEEDYQRQQQEINELRRMIGLTKQDNIHRSKTRRDNDKFIPQFKDQRIQKSTSRTIRNAGARLIRIENNPIPKPPKPLRFRPPDKLGSIRSAEVISVIHIYKSYGTKCVLDEIGFSLSHDARVIITGPNGSGKSTLLRILVGKDSAYKGTIKYAPNVRIGFLPQEPEIEKSKQTVISYFRHGLIGYDEDFVFDLVTCGLFEYNDLKKQIGQLSLGQIRKLQIARLIADKPNVLVLDEPTNYLSLDVLESFENALHNFQGPILAVSHDRIFIKQFGMMIREISNSQLTTKTIDNLS